MHKHNQSIFKILVVAVMADIMERLRIRVHLEKKILTAVNTIPAHQNPLTESMRVTTEKEIALISTTETKLEEST